MTTALVLAVAVYTMAHVLRALRFWLLYEESALRFRGLVLLHQVGSSMGGFVPAALIEILRFFVLVGLVGRQKILKLFTISLLCRMFDLLVLSLPNLIYFLWLRDRAWNSEILIFSLAIGALLALFFSSSDALVFLKSSAISKKGNRLSVIAVEVLHEIQSNLMGLMKAPIQRLIFNFLLTVGIWTLDIVALRIAFDGIGTGPSSSALDTVDFWVQNSFHRLVYFRGEERAGLEAAYEALANSQIWVSAIFILIFIAYMRKRNAKVTFVHR